MTRQTFLAIGITVAALCTGGCAATGSTSATGDHFTVDTGSTMADDLPPGAELLPAAPAATPEPTEGVAPVAHVDTLAPDGQPPEVHVPEIVARGRLIVGIDQSQNLLSFKDPTTGQLKGFEVDVAREIARDIFGSDGHIEFRFVDSTDRLTAVSSGLMDLVVRTTTITPERAAHVRFSAPYFTAHTRLLVNRGSGITGARDLSGKTVCVAKSSTALPLARRIAPAARLLTVRSWSDCLVALQQSQADAVLSDDTVLAGIAAQDPFTQITGESLGQGDYGVVIAQSTPGHSTDGLVRQVNGTLARMVADGTWWRLYRQWLAPYQTTSGPPRPHYAPAAEGERTPQ